MPGGSADVKDAFNPVGVMLDTWRQYPVGCPVKSLRSFVLDNEPPATP